MADSLALPAAFLKTLRDVHADADAWLARLPHLIAACETRWNLRVVGQAGRLSYALVLFAERHDGTPVVLKMSPPSPEASREAEALKFYGGDGICRLLGHDPEGEVLLLEKLSPGTSLWDLWTPARDDAHTHLAAQLMTRLWRPASPSPRSHYPVPPAHPFRTLASWAEALFEQTPEGRLPYAQVRRAQGLFTELHVTDAPVLLHADLHHGNILSAESEPYLAIDPKGVVGARGYEVGPYLLNPELDRHAGLHTNLSALCARRVAIFSEMLDMDETEVAAWGFIHMLLSACWSLEDHGGGHETALRVAESLERLL